MAKSTDQKPLIINEFDQAIAPSPEKGHALLRNANIVDFPGAMKSNYKPSISIVVVTQQVCTFSNSGGVLLATSAATFPNIAGTNYDYAAVTFTNSGGALPTGISANTIYYLKRVTDTTFYITVSWETVNEGDPTEYIQFTDAGSGTNTAVPVAIGTINWLKKDLKTGYRFALDSNGRVWFNINGDLSSGASTFYLMVGALNNTTTTQGNGLAIFTNANADTFLFVFKQTVADCVIISNSGLVTSATPDWETSILGSFTVGAANVDHYAFVSTNNLLYWTDGWAIGSFQEMAGKTFDPDDATTYTGLNTALSLPYYENSKCIEQINDHLYIGTTTSNRIYPWDRLAQAFDVPLFMPEIGVYRIKNTGNIAYILGGQKGNIYQTQGSYVSWVAKIPNYIINNAGTVVENPVTWGDMAVWLNSVIFGASVQTTGNSGLFRMFFDGRIIQENTPSTGSNQINALIAETDFYFMGYASNIDNFKDNSARYNNYECVFQSQLYEVGNAIEKAKFSRLEVSVANPNSGDHFRVKSRGDKTSVFADFGTPVNQTTDGATTLYTFDIGLIDIQNLQLQLEFDGSTEYIEIRLFP